MNTHFSMKRRFVRFKTFKRNIKSQFYYYIIFGNGKNYVGLVSYLKILVKVSSKGQIVIPKRVREMLGIGKNTILTLRVIGKKIILEPVSEPPEDIFVSAGEKIVDEALSEVKRDEKILRLLRDLGIED